MSARKTITVEPGFAEHSTYGGRAKVTVYDSWRGRKVAPKIVMVDLTPQMLAHIAETCMNSLRALEKELTASIKAVKEA